jgi:hypothetical protein
VEFVCSYCTSLKDLTGFENLTSCEIFYCSSCYNLESLKGLESLVECKEFNCLGCISLTDLSGLDNLKKCKELVCNKCDKLKSIDALQKANIDEFVCNGCPNLEDTEVLINFKSFDSVVRTGIEFGRVIGEIWVVFFVPLVTILSCCLKIIGGKGLISNFSCRVLILPREEFEHILLGITRK